MIAKRLLPELPALSETQSSADFGSSPQRPFAQDVAQVAEGGMSVSGFCAWLS